MPQPSNSTQNIISRTQRNWLLFGGISILLRIMLPASFIEQVYSRGLYPWIRAILDGIHQWIPLHWFWVLIFGLLFIIVKYVIRLYRTERSKKRMLFRLGTGLVTVLIGLAGLFLWLWGFNYGRNNFYRQIDLEPIDLNLEKMKALYEDQMVLLGNWRSRLIGKSSVVLPNRLPNGQYNEILRRLLQDFELAPSGDPVIKEMVPQGFLLRLGTSGFYNPISGESNLDPGLHPLQIPFVTAHELSHAYGITDEGACNFLAVLVGREIETPEIRYAFELTFFRYISSQFRRMNEKEYISERKKLPASIARDLKAIRANGDLYPDFFPKFRDRTYELYLKTQGIQEGLGSYNKVVNMVVAWDNKRAAR